MIDTKALNKRKSEILDAKESVLKSKLEAGNGLNETEKAVFADYNKELEAIDLKLTEIKAIERGRSEVGTPTSSPAVGNDTKKSKFMAYSGGYKPTTTMSLDEKGVADFWRACKSSNSFSQWQIRNAALGEGGTTADGSALVPIETDPSIPALQIVECSARRLSKVITTSMNINLPYQSAKSVAAIKAESNNSGTNAFGTSVPQFATTELQAYVVGNSIYASWELLEDAKAANQFLPAELQRAITVEEEYYFVNGSGSSQPQGYLGNATTATGANITSGGATLGINPIIETMGTLNARYYGNAKWLVNRQEFNRLLEKQIAASQFQTFVTFEPNGNARLFGYPVEFSAEMPQYVASPATNGNWLFGDFSSYAVIGDRGDSNIRIKVLDQVAALNGQTVVLGYRRTDQRILLSEAVVQFNATA